MNFKAIARNKYPIQDKLFTLRCALLHTLFTDKMNFVTKVIT